MTIRDNGPSGKIGGEPVAVRAPTELIVISGEGSTIPPSMHGKIQDAYNRFLHIKRTSIIPNLIREVRLDDGTRVRIESKFGKDRIMVWPESSEVPQEIWPGGFMWQLGSNPGLDTTNVLFNAKYDKRRGLALPEYKLIYNCPPRWGDVDWQGEDPKVDVLSWNVQSVERWDLSYTTPVGVNAFSNVPTKPRYFSRGTGMSVYSRFGTLHTTSTGFAIEGAAYVRLDRKYLVFVRRITGIAFQVVLVVDGSERIIGTYTRPNSNLQVMHSWFFSQSGRKARTVLFSVNAMFVVEMTISGTNADNAIATFSATSNQTYPAASPRVTDSWYTYAEIRPEGGYIGTSIRTSTHDPVTITPESPVLCTDFRGESPVELRLRRTDIFPYSHTTEMSGTSGGPAGTNYSSGTRTSVKTGLVDKFVIQTNGEDGEMFDAFVIDCSEYTASVSSNAPPVYLTPFTCTYTDIKILDIDLRTGARVFQRLTHVFDNISTNGNNTKNYDVTLTASVVFNSGGGGDVVIDSTEHAFKVNSYSPVLAYPAPSTSSVDLNEPGEYSGSWRINAGMDYSLNHDQFLKMFGRHFILGGDNDIHTGRNYWPIHTPLGYEATQPPVGAIRTYYGLALGAGHIFSYTPISAAPTITETVATSEARGYRLSISNDPLAMLIADIFDKFELTHSGTTWPAKLGVY